MAKRNSSFDLLLAADCETSGLAFGYTDPTYNVATGEVFQAVSFGLIIANAHTLKPIDELYLLIQHEEGFAWADRAQEVHGLSREYLQEFGVTKREAAILITQFLEKYFGPAEAIRRITLLGHNVASFDRYFLEQLLAEINSPIRLGNRHVDTFSLGFTTMKCFDSDELFDTMGLERDPNNHNALEDARHALTSARLIRKFFNQAGEK